MHTMVPPIVHRDIQAENIILGADSNWKLCGFRKSVILDASAAVDILALGSLIYNLLFFRAPFDPELPFA